MGAGTQASICNLINTAGLGLGQKSPVMILHTPSSQFQHVTFQEFIDIFNYCNHDTLTNKVSRQRQRYDKDATFYNNKVQNGL